ncbi:MAG: type II secretion system protein [Armatimonadetes bacterium]|nr:type II secretion system protein [Armatimonadota bacterium]
MSGNVRPGRGRPADGGGGRPPSPRAACGFTLVELLVVIAVISVLAAVLLPVFVRARAKSQQVACLSNLRQVTLGILMYSQDNDDRCPLYSDGAGTYWPQFVAPYVQRQASADFNGASKVFVCPAAPYDAAQVTAFGSSALPSYGLSDNWVDQVCPDDCWASTGVPHALGEAVAPSGTVLLAETMARTERGLPGYALATPPIDGGNMNGPGGPYFDCGPGEGAFSPARMLADLSWRHAAPKAAWCADPPAGARIGVAYADGHVASVTAARLSAFRQWSLRQGAGASGCRPDAAGDGQGGCWYP